MTGENQASFHFGIDGFPLTERPWANSVNHFVTEILLQLRPQEWDARFTCFTRRSRFKVPDTLNEAPVRWSQPFGRNFVWRHVALPLAAKRADVDVMWYPFNLLPFWTTTPSVVTVHDISFVTLPHLFDWHGRIYFGTMLRRALAQASQIVTISRFTADELTRLFGVEPNRMTVIHHGFNNRAISFDVSAGDELIHQSGVREPYYLFLGGDNPRKNIELLLKLLCHSSANIVTNSQFVITGDIQRIGSLLAGYGMMEKIGKQIILPGLLSESHLDVFYRKARALLYLSHYEGFGFPILEAFARDCPVIALRSSSLPEVAGKAALFVKDGNISQLEDAITEVANNNTRGELIRAGRQQGLKFSWSEAAQHLYQTLVKVAKSRL